MRPTPARSRLARIAGIAGVGLLALAIAAPATSAADDAMVRVLHGSPDAPTVDILVNDVRNKDLSGLSFGDISDYVAVPGGTYNIKVCLATDNTNCVIDADLAFAAGKKYTVAASDLASQIKADLIVDGNAKAGETRVRAVHLSADTPAVDVRPDGGEPVLTNLPYREASSYLKLPGGKYDLEVCATGTDTCPLDLPEVNLKNGVAYSVFAIGQLQPADGQEALTFVAAVDGMAAPATDTVGASENGSTANGALVALLTAVATITAAGTLRLAAARTRR